jgi:hypothetical protein
MVPLAQPQQEKVAHLAAFRFFERAGGLPPQPQRRYETG